MTVVLEEVLKCGADGAFIFCTVLGIFFEFSVICFYGLMRRFDVEIWHLFSPDVVGGRNNAKLYTGWGEMARRILLYRVNSPQLGFACVQSNLPTITTP